MKVGQTVLTRTCCWPPLDGHRLGEALDGEFRRAVDRAVDAADMAPSARRCCISEPGFPAAISFLATERVRSRPPRRLTPITASKSSTVVSIAGLWRAMPGAGDEDVERLRRLDRASTAAMSDTSSAKRFEPAQPFAAIAATASSSCAWPRATSVTTAPGLGQRAGAGQP